MFQAHFKILNGQIVFAGLYMDSAGKETGAGTHERIGAKMAENPHRLVGLVGLIVTFRQGIQGFLVIGGKINGFADKGHGFFGFFHSKERVTHVAENGGVVRIHCPRLLKELYRLFVIFLVKFKNTQIIIDFKIVLFNGTGHGKALIGLIGHIELHGALRVVKVHVKRLYSMGVASGNQVKQRFIGF